MAIEPAAIAASPPITIRRVFDTAPESPAASAKGTVSPSDMPITTSRTKFPEVKCFSLWMVRAISSPPLRTTPDIVLPDGLLRAHRDKQACLRLLQAESKAPA